MLRIPSRPDPELESRWSKVLGYAERLFTSLDELDEAGGSARAVAAGGWSVPAIDRALGTLLAAREGLDSEIARLEQRRKHYPRARRLG